MFRSYTLSFLFVLMFGLNGWSQDPVFSQYHSTPMWLNPALTGLVDAPVISLTYRNQWPAISQAYTTYAATYSQYAPKLNSGFGVSAMADVQGNGIYTATQIGLYYAYDVRFSETFFLRAGLEGNFINKRLAWEKLIFLDQIDPLSGAYDQFGNLNPTGEIQPNLSVSYFDFGAGMLINTPYFYAGVSLKHINAPREGLFTNTFGELPMRVSLHAGSEINLNSNNKIGKTTFISPSVLFIKQRQFHQLNIGAHIKHDIFLAGLSFRHTFTNADAVILMMGIQKGIFKLGYSYDLTVSQLGMSSGGAHEVSLVLNFEDKRKKRRRNYNDCLNLFK